MSEVINVERTEDCQGSFCPVPIIRASQAIKSLRPGQILEVIATDPGSKGDFKAFAKNTGHELVQSTDESGVFRYYLRVAG